MKRLGLAMGFWGLVCLVGCGGDGETGLTGGTITGPTGTGGSAGSGGNGTGGNGTGGMGTGGMGGGPTIEVHDPNVDGPYKFEELDDPSFTVPATGAKVPIHVAHPLDGGPTSGPYPVIVVAHGFQLPASQYYGYVRRLASFGYVALTADYPTSFVGTNNTDAAKNIIAALDWVAGKPELKGDTDLAGATGHSLGGKLAMHAAVVDARFKASIVLDPVDGAPGNPINPNPRATCRSAST